MQQVSRRTFMKSNALLGMGAMLGPLGKEAFALNASDKIDLKDGTLKGSLNLLDMWGRQPDAVRDRFSAAYNALAKSRTATFSDVAADKDVQRICKQQGVLHWGGPMLGSVTSTGARVWIRTVRPAKVEVAVAVDGKGRLFGPVESTTETDMAAVVQIEGLAPEKTYTYRVLVDGQEIPIPENAALTTAPSETEAQSVRITFGTCYHRWGLGNQKMSSLIRSRKPAAMLLGGDIAVQDRNNDFAMHRADYLLRDFHPAWQALVAQVPVFATWDDHDYFDNDKAGIPKGYRLEDKQGVWDVFRHSWNNPSYAYNDDRRGIFFRTRIGCCDAIMLDHRYFRNGEKGSFLGEDQMQWLERELLACAGPFIILSCGTMWSDYYSNGKDSWGAWDPAGRERIFQFIEKHKIGGVLLISGDRHGARGVTIPRPSGFSFYEFEAASLGGRTGPKKGAKTVPFYFINGEYAFGEFTIEAKLKDPKVTFRLIGEAGNEIHKLTLTRSQLTPQ